MKHSIFFIIGAAMLLTTASCHVETLEPLCPDAVQSAPYAGQLAFRADLSCGPATRSDYDTFEVEQPSTGKKVDVEVFLRPMAGGTMSGICDAPAEPFMETGDVDYEVADAARFAETRSAPVESMYTSFRFVAPPYGEKTATRTSSGYYSVDNLRYSDFEDPAVFFCWAPGNAQGVSYDVATGHLSYVASSDVTFQPDLVAARSAAIPPDNDQPVELTFRHLLAGIQVKTASIFPGCTVNHVTLKNVCKQGTYDPATATWTADTETLMDLELLPAARPNVTTDYMLADGAYTAMVVPQVLPAGAEVAIELVFNNFLFNYAYPLSGKTLSAGTILELSVDGRSMFLLEGEATGPFNVRTSNTNSGILYTVSAADLDEDGCFSVLLPFSNGGANNVISFGNAQANDWNGSVKNTTLTKITRLPDYFDTLPSISCMFRYCTALEEITCEIPGSEKVRPCAQMFYGCKSLVRAPWFNSSSSTTFARFFEGCSSLEEIPLYDTSNSTSFSRMFTGCASLTEIPLLDTSNGTSFSSMFQECSSLETIPAIDTSNGVYFDYMFYKCTSLTEIPFIDTSGCSVFSNMFGYTSNLETIPLLDTSNGTNFTSMFESSGIRTLPAIDVSSGTNFNSMFKSCRRLTETGTLDTDSGTNFKSFMNGCSLLAEIKVTSTAEGTDFSMAWSGAASIVSIPDNLNFEKATSMYNTFYGCSSLKTVPSFRYPECTTFENTFASCGNLETVGVMYTPKVISLNQTFSGCRKLKSSPLRETSTATNWTMTFINTSVMTDYTPLDFSSAVNCNQTFLGSGIKTLNYINAPNCTNYNAIIRNCYSLQTFEGCDMSGMRASVSLVPTNSITYIGPLTGMRYSVSLSGANNLTHDSLVDIIGSLADVSDGAVQTLTIGSTNLAKLSVSEIAVATAKGWTVQ